MKWIRANLLAYRRVLDIPLVVGAGFLAYLLLAFITVDRLEVMPLGMKRIIEVNRFLDRQSRGTDSKDVYFVGSSVSLEGVDCGEVDKFLPSGCVSYNLAWTGASSRQWIMVVPSLKTAKPGMVVLGLDLLELLDTQPISDERLAVAGWWKFVPPEDLDRFKDVLNDNERKLLGGRGVRDLLIFRAFPPGALDGYFRETLRPSLRYEGYETNFKAPWVRRKAVSPPAMARGVNRRLHWVKERKPEDMKATLKVLKAILSYFGDLDCKVLLVLTPVHPDLIASMDKKLLADVDRTLTELARSNDAVFLNHSTLLRSDQFNDALHPSDSGRQTWSCLLGRIVREQLTGASQ